MSVSADRRASFAVAFAAGVGRVVAIARRELAACAHAAVSYAVGAAFLLVQGFSFWATVLALSDPRRPAPLGAVMSTFIGGGLLYWGAVFVVLAALAMRLVAEERRHGSWELLVTTPASEGEIALGKWLGAWLFYLALWLPTLVYPAVLVGFAPAGARPELAPIALTYLGVALSGGALLAVALAAGAATANPIVAVVAGFAAMLAVLVLGELPGLVDLPDALAGALAAVDLRSHAAALARGVIELDALLAYAALATAGLAFTAALVGVGRRTGAALAARLLAACLVALIGGLVAALAAPRDLSWDLAAGRVNSLATETRAVLAAVDAPVSAIVIRAGEPGFDGVYAEVDRLLRRMQRAQPRLAVDTLDPALEPGRVTALAGSAVLPAEVLAGGGAVVFSRGDRAQVVELLDMAAFDRDAIGGGSVAAFRAEAAFADALVAVLDRERPRVCVTTGHGELDAEATSAEHSALTLMSRLSRAGARVETVPGLRGGVPAGCRALCVLGPRRALSAGEAEAVARYLGAGGRLLVAVDALPATDGPGLAPHGLELVLAGYGLRTPDAVVVDPEREIGVSYTFATYDGYLDHAITGRFADRRATVWPAPRAVVLAPTEAGRDSALVVESSSGSWAETDLGSLFGGRGSERQSADPAGPIGLAAIASDAATGARVVLFGSARALATDFASRELGANIELAAAGLDWLFGRHSQIALEDRTPRQVRLVMTRAARRAVAVVCIGLLPLALVCVGVVVGLRRRRG